MRYLTIFSIIAAVALVGAGCVSSIDTEDSDTTVNEVQEVQEDVVEESGEEFAIGYDEGIEVVYLGGAQGTVNKEFTGQQIITADYAYDPFLGVVCFEFSEEEITKIPDATGGDLEHYCTDSDLEMFGEEEKTNIAGVGTFRIGKVEISEVGGANMWTLELLEIME